MVVARKRKNKLLLPPPLLRPLKPWLHRSLRRLLPSRHPLLNQRIFRLANYGGIVAFPHGLTIKLNIVWLKLLLPPSANFVK